MRFEGTSAYVATDDLKVAVNAAKQQEPTIDHGTLPSWMVPYSATGVSSRFNLPHVHATAR